MSAQFTPGPWEAAFGRCVYAGDALIADCGDDVYDPSAAGVAKIEEVRCNAVLIAAAPALYSALDTLMTWMDKPGPKGGWYEAKCAAWDALGKAKGAAC